MNSLTWTIIVLVLAMLCCIVYMLKIVLALRESQIEMRNNISTNNASLESVMSDFRRIKTTQEQLDVAIQEVKGVTQATEHRLDNLLSHMDEITKRQGELMAASQKENLQALPRLNGSEFLKHVSFDDFFTPPADVNYEEKRSQKDNAWLQVLLGGSEFAIKAYDSVKTFNEQYVGFAPDIEAKLKSGVAKLMTSTEGVRCIVTENGKIIGHGIIKNGPKFLHGAASIFSTVTAAAYIVVAHDTQKQLLGMNAMLLKLTNDEVRLRQSKIEANYESLRRISQSACSQDRAVVLNIITDLHQMRSFLRRQILEKSRNIQEIGFLKANFLNNKAQSERRESFDEFRADLLQSHQIFRLEAFAVSLLNDSEMEDAFKRTVTEEAERLRQMHNELTARWHGDKVLIADEGKSIVLKEIKLTPVGRAGANNEVEPVILKEINDLSRLYKNCVEETDALVKQVHQERKI